MHPTADWTDRLTMEDYLAETEHAAYLHYEGAYDAALALAEVALPGALLSGDHDGCLLPGRGYLFLAETPRAGATVMVAPASGGTFVAAVAERYTHVVCQIGGDERAHYASEGAALGAAARRSVGEVRPLAIYALDGGGPVALALDGTIWRPTAE